MNTLSLRQTGESMCQLRMLRCEGGLRAVGQHYFLKRAVLTVSGNCSIVCSLLVERDFMKRKPSRATALRL